MDPLSDANAQPVHVQEAVVMAPGVEENDMLLQQTAIIVCVGWALTQALREEGALGQLGGVGLHLLF